MGVKTDHENPARKRISEHIAETIVNEIRSGNLAIGSALSTERELCDRFSTSRPSVREAVSLLEIRGFLTTTASKRPVISEPSLEYVLLSTADHIREILGSAESAAHLEQMRQFMEVGAVREAAKRASNIQMTTMRSALEKNFAAIGTDEFPASDIAFHRAIMTVLDNTIVLKLHDMFVSTMIATRPPVVDHVAHDKLVYEEHRVIYEAILANDILVATDTIDKHLARSYRSRLAVPHSLATE